MKEYFIITCNLYYYTFFKKDPCKKCLVQSCCGIECLDKSEWDIYSDNGRNKKAFQKFNLIAIIYTIIILIFSISKLMAA